jgi:hypothetical protein
MPVVPASVEAPKPELSKRDKVIMACAEAVHEMLRILYEAVENAGPLEHWEKSDATLQDEAIQIVTEVFNKDNPEFENNKGESDLIVATVVAMGKALGCQSRSLGTVDLP